MTQVLAATGALFRDRDFFVHDGVKLRRLRLSAPVQARSSSLLLMALVGWSATPPPACLNSRPYAAARGRSAVRLFRPRSPGLPPKPNAASSRSSSARCSRRDARRSNMSTPDADAARLLPGQGRRERPGRSVRRASAIRPSSRCSPAGRSSTICRRRHRHPVRQAGQDRRIHLGLRHPLRSLPAAAQRCTRDRSRRPVRHADLRHRRRHRQRAGWNSGGYGNLIKVDHGRGIETRYGHMSAILVHRRRSRDSRPADRPHGLDRPLDRQPPPL